MSEQARSAAAANPTGRMDVGSRRAVLSGWLGADLYGGEQTRSARFGSAPGRIAGDGAGDWSWRGFGGPGTQPISGWYARTAVIASGVSGLTAIGILVSRYVG